jgi:hypothetical protein
MKAFIAALLVIAGIGFGAATLLETYQRTADGAYTTSGARIEPDPRLTGAPKG